MVGCSLQLRELHGIYADYDRLILPVLRLSADDEKYTDYGKEK